MKKIMSFALAAVMAAAMSVTAFAAETGVTTGEYQVDVIGNYKEGSGAAGEKVSVDISWSGMSFTYTAASQGEWNAKEHNYGEGTAASWSEKKGSVTVRNHSNCGITASFKFEKDKALDVTGTFYNKNGEDYKAITSEKDQKFDLTTAVGTTRDDKNAEKDQTPTKTIYFNITDGSIAEGTKDIGKIVVTIAKTSK